ncbi:MAG: glucose 1-dehydrogenase [Kiloniellales bacterium]|nr:glucose 1-dehydrogenase [Kiloniellales bacterium]
MENDLRGRTAIVTGAASGIGRAIAKRFAAAGVRVAIADRRPDPIEGGRSTLAEIEEHGGEAFYGKCDVSDWSDVDEIVEQVVDRWGRLDILVNNAAIYASKPLLETSKDEWDRVLAVNLTGVFLCCKRAVRQFMRQEPLPGDEARGRIVNISSQHGMIAAPGDIAYGVGKAGVVYITRQIAADYAKDGVVCNAVAPGKILTGKSGAAVDPQTLEYASLRTPWPRLGQPEDVASAALFLAGPAASFITGVNLLVDGGWMAS